MHEWNVEICDVTLRDGEQTPGVSFTCEEKIGIANLLDAVGVEIIEAGFPVVSDAEKTCVTRICNSKLDADICCLARAKQGDVDVAIDCGVDLVSIFIATSELHVRHKYRKPRDQVLDEALDLVTYAKDHGLRVRFAAEDASRTEVDFLKRMYSEGYERGADYSSFADTVGCMTPMVMQRVVGQLLDGLKNPFSIHCHNDMGCATANTITAAEVGAFQLHTTVNGIGERAGNARLDEILVLLKKKGGVDRYDLHLLHELSELVERYTGVTMPVTKPIVGKHAFAHESGIHIAAILEDPLTYEYIAPEEVGTTRSFILGKHTGLRAIRHVVATYGYDLNDDQMIWILGQVKARSEGKCAITPAVFCNLIKLAKEAHPE